MTKRTYLIQQPPSIPKYRIIVDEMRSKRNYGQTYDLDKIAYNLKQFGQELIEEIKIQNLFTTTGVTFVFNLGRFISVLGMAKEENEGSMIFYDFDVNMSTAEIRELLILRYSEKIVEQFLGLQKQMIANFDINDDKFDLYVPNDAEIIHSLN